jgi:hypothetical protein
MTMTYVVLATMLTSIPVLAVRLVRLARSK